MHQPLGPVETGRTSLDPRTLTVDQHTTDTPEQAWRFSTRTEDRRALLAIMGKLYIDRRHKERFRSCGIDSFIEYSESGQCFRVKCIRCKLRWCPACARTRARHIVEWCKQCVTTQNRRTWKFVTLTLAHSRRPLTEQLDHLKSSFRRLRQTQAWKERMAGGIAVIEVKRNKQTSQWHPHLHVVVKGKYLGQAELSALWKKCSKGSFIVDIRAISDANEAGVYLAKYISKPVDLSLCDDADSLSEFLNTLTGTRMFIRFGDIPNYDDAMLDQEYPRDWKTICPLSSALAEAKAGNLYYVAMMTAVERRNDEPFDPDDYEAWQSDLSIVPYETG